MTVSTSRCMEKLVYVGGEIINSLWLVYVLISVRDFFFSFDYNDSVLFCPLSLAMVIV